MVNRLKSGLPTKNNFETNGFTFCILLHNIACQAKVRLHLATCVSPHATVQGGQRELVQSRYPSFANKIVFFFSPEAEINACAGRETQIKNVVP